MHVSDLAHTDYTSALLTLFELTREAILCNAFTADV